MCLLVAQLLVGFAPVHLHTVREFFVLRLGFDEYVLLLRSIVPCDLVIVDLDFDRHRDASLYDGVHEHQQLLCLDALVPQHGAAHSVQQLLTLLDLRYGRVLFEGGDNRRYQGEEGLLEVYVLREQLEEGDRLFGLGLFDSDLFHILEGSIDFGGVVQEKFLKEFAGEEVDQVGGNVTWLK